MPAWTCKPHTDLTTAELYALLTLRSVVFVMEQNCPYLDMDGLDLQGQTRHLMAGTMARWSPTGCWNRPATKAGP